MDDLIEGSSIGPYPYRIMRRIGRQQGNMGDVYLATTGETGAAEQQPSPLVVIKITRVDEKHGEFYKATLENEVDRLRRLKHPGIVRLYPIQKVNLRNLPYMAQSNLPGRPWFSVMEYLAGDSLANLLHEQTRLDIGVALEIARNLAVTLDYLHNLNQVHLDIKPENILFRQPLRSGTEPQPVLIDFGIARTVGQAGLEAGTLQWSAPERVRFVRGDKPPETVVRPSPSMDIYALGMVLYVMIAGRLPFADRSKKGITTAILEGNPTAPSLYQPVIHKELDDLILMTLAADPAQRPRADELARAIEELSIRLGYRPRYGYVAPQPVKPTVGRVATNGKTRLALAVLGTLVAVESVALLARWPQPSSSRLAATAQSSPVVQAATLPKANAVNLESSQGQAAPAAATATGLISPAPVRPTATLAQAASISTLIPTSTPTPTPTLTATVEPVAAAVPAAVNNVATPKPAPQPVPAPVRQVVLQGPGDNSKLNGRQTFSWNTNVAPGLNEAFEVVIYKQGQNQLSGAGLADPVTGNAVTVDLNAINQNPGHPLNPGDWLWGVNLVQRTPYKPLQSLAGGWRFNFTP